MHRNDITIVRNGQFVFGRFDKYILGTIKESTFAFKLLVSSCTLYVKARLVIHPETSDSFSVFIGILRVEIWFCGAILYFHTVISDQLRFKVPYRN